MHEPKHLHPERQPFNSNKTLVIKEFSIKNDNEPYYPINDEKIELNIESIRMKLKKLKSLNLVVDLQIMLTTTWT